MLADHCIWLARYSHGSLLPFIYKHLGDHSNPVGEIDPTDMVEETGMHLIQPQQMGQQWMVCCSRQMTNNLIDVSFYFLTFSCSFYFDVIFRSHYLYICLSSSIWHVNSFVEVFFSSTRSKGKNSLLSPLIIVLYI